MTNNPKISIITVVFNGVKFLEKTIQSIFNQNYNNIEYIIIDGGSTDGTINIIKKYENKIAYWVSESDNGIYDAMNKGINFATGKGLLFLNAGDYFSKNVLNENIIIPSFLLVKYINIFGKITDTKIKSHKFSLPNSHQGIIFENKNIKYNLKYKVSSDYDYFLRHTYTNKLPIVKTEGFIYYDNNGYSVNNHYLRDKEIYDIIKSNHGLFYALLFFIFYMIKNILKIIIRLFK